MADLKKLAMGRKAFLKPAGATDAAKAKKPAKNLEETCRKEVGELETAFRERIAKEDKRRVAATDAETWVCVYFKSREEKQAFLRKHGLDKIGDKYLPGSAVDRVLSKRTLARDGHRKER